MKSSCFVYVGQYSIGLSLSLQISRFHRMRKCIPAKVNKTPPTANPSDQRAQLPCTERANPAPSPARTIKAATTAAQRKEGSNAAIAKGNSAPTKDDKLDKTAARLDSTKTAWPNRLAANCPWVVRFSWRSALINWPRNSEYRATKNTNALEISAAAATRNPRLKPTDWESLVRRPAANVSAVKMPSDNPSTMGRRSARRNAKVLMIHRLRVMRSTRRLPETSSSMLCTTAPVDSIALTTSS
jgi:hypothetical protein